MSSFLQALAKPQPIPGGGGAAAQAALTGLALLTKVIALEAARPDLSPDRQESWRRAEQRAWELKQALLRLRRQDGRAYLSWTKNRGRADEAKYARILTEVPQEIIACVFEVLELARSIRSISKKHLGPDISAAAELAQGAALAAGRIASANAAQVKDPRDRDRLNTEGGELIMKIFRAAQEVQRSPRGKRNRP